MSAKSFEFNEKAVAASTALLPIYKRPKDHPTSPQSAANRFHTKSQSHDQARSVFSSSPNVHLPSTPNPIVSTKPKQQARPQSARLSSASNRPRNPAPFSLLPSMPERSAMSAHYHEQPRTTQKPMLPRPSTPNCIGSAKFNQRTRPQTMLEKHIIDAKRSAMSTHLHAKNNSKAKPEVRRVRKPPTDEKEEEKTQKRPNSIRKKLIGAGAFGRVYRVCDAKSGKPLAMKEITISHKLDSSVFKREVQIMRKLKHPNIVQFKGHQLIKGRTAHSLCIFMEFVHGRTIPELYIKRERPFEECVIAKYTAQLLQALDYAHSRKIIHRDIKGGNIMISTRDEQVKLCDFGAAKVWESGNSKMSPSMNFQNSPHWTAPEVMRDKGYDAKVDVWSVGCVMIEMATAGLPWAECGIDNIYSMLWWIGQDGHKPKIPEGLSKECRDMIQKCLQRDPDQRCSARLLMGHTFVKGFS